MAMASSSCGLLGLACFVLLVAAAGATQYKVGGDNGWAVPDAAAESFNTWAEKTSFQIGDSLCESPTHICITYTLRIVSLSGESS
jgi:hypothetical protein